MTAFRTVASVDREVAGLSDDLRDAELRGDWVDANDIATAIDELLELRLTLASAEDV